MKKLFLKILLIDEKKKFSELLNNRMEYFVRLKLNIYNCGILRALSIMLLVKLLNFQIYSHNSSAESWEMTMF